MAQCFYYSNNDGTACDYSAWLFWGRWVLLAAIILVVIAVFLVSARISARQRHKAGRKPYVGTQFMLGRAPPTYASTVTLPTYESSSTQAEVQQKPVIIDVESQRVSTAAQGSAPTTS